MRILLVLSIAAALVGCATPQTPIAVGAIEAGRGQKVNIDQSILLVDTSGSIDRRETFPGEKALVQSLVSSMPKGRYEAGATNFGGVLRQTHPLSAFDRSALGQHASGLRYLSEGTPIDDALSEAGAELEGKRGRAAITLLSDGVPSDPFGREVPSERVFEAASEAAEGYNGKLCLHTVQLGNDPRGAAVLRKLSKTTGCGSFREASSLSSAKTIRDFQREVYLGAARKAAPPPPPPAAKPKIGDRDGDGVRDDRDSCPNTPSGARPDSRGCWVIEGLNFATNSAAIEPASKRRLQSEVIPVLQRASRIRVRIDGHTDSRGAAAYNQSLSMRRAASVRDFFVANGIDARRLQARGFGESKPIAPNDSAANLRKNRRTELTVLDQ